MSDFPHQILKIERELMRIVDMVSNLERRAALTDQNNALLWYNRGGCTNPGFILTASPASPQNSGTSVTFTATLTGFPNTPTGTIQFMDGASNLGSPVTLIGGVATFTTSSLSVATHTINAVYSGDSTFCSATQSISYQITSSVRIQWCECVGNTASTTMTVVDSRYAPGGVSIVYDGTRFKGCVTGVTVPAQGSCGSVTTDLLYTLECVGAGVSALRVHWKISGLCVVTATCASLIAGLPDTFVDMAATSVSCGPPYVAHFSYSGTGGALVSYAVTDTFSVTGT